MSMILNDSGNKGKNRRRLDIVRDMLSILSVKVRKTRIMYQANLSYLQVEKYLNGLLESGLVEYDGHSCYFITGKGKEFLQMHANYVERCKRIVEDVEGAYKDRLLLESLCFNDECNCRRTANRTDVLK